MLVPRESPVLVVGGSGVMGRGIAYSFARAGFPTTVMSRDASRAAAALALWQQQTKPQQCATIEACDALPSTPPALIIETIVESMEEKKKLLTQIASAYFVTDQPLQEMPIVGSNTSSLPLQELADACPNPAMQQRFCGMHYFQPAEDQVLVEFSRVAQTSQGTEAAVLEMLATTGKEAVVLRRPIQGLLLNRLQHAIYREVYSLMADGVVTAADVDLAARRMLGPRMCVTGLCEQKDIAGLDTHSLSGESLVPSLNRDPHFSHMVSAMRHAGTIGVKSKVSPEPEPGSTGRQGRTGFYDWTNVDAPARQQRNSEMLTSLFAFLHESRANHAQEELELGPLPPTEAGKDNNKRKRSAL